jgi:cathepsin D
VTLLSFTAITVQGNPIALPEGSTSFSAIDTGTTLVGGPSDAISAIYAQIPNSVEGTGNYEGYYMYREHTYSMTILSDLY